MRQFGWIARQILRDFLGKDGVQTLKIYLVSFYQLLINERVDIIKACPDGVKKDGHFHLAPPNLKFVLRPRTDIELPSNYAEFDSALDCIKQLF